MAIARKSPGQTYNELKLGAQADISEPVEAHQLIGNDNAE